MRLARHEPLFLLLGDITVFYVALWLTLLIRYFEAPSADLWWTHALPFTILFFISALVYFIAGLYDQHTLLLRRRLPVLVTTSQLVTVVLAALFFFMVPYFGIAPKTNLVIFLVLSSIMIVLWRLTWARLPGIRTPSNAMVLGAGEEIQELIKELDGNPRYRLHVAYNAAPSDVVVSQELQDQIRDFIAENNITVVIADTRDKHMSEIIPVLYNLVFVHRDLVVLDAMHLYEAIFRRIPVSMLKDAWFIEHITRTTYAMQKVFHRLVDIGVGLVLGAVWLVVLPFVWLAIRHEDRGPLYVEQVRVGKHNQPIRIRKFRTMSGSDEGDEVLSSTLSVTKVGRILRPTRIDELPQYLNVLRGDLSFIGPRPELPALAVLYAEQIPYYRTRHLIIPGLTGWAQLYHDEHPHHGTNIEETRNKLSYDLYYLKRRSILLDIEIGLKTIRKILTRSGA